MTIMRITYPQVVRITFRGILHPERVWRTCPPALCTTQQPISTLWIAWKTYPLPLWKTSALPLSSWRLWKLLSAHPDEKTRASISLEFRKTGSKISSAVLHIFQRLSTILPDLSTFWAFGRVFSHLSLFIVSPFKNQARFQGSVDNVEKLCTSFVEKKLLDGCLWTTWKSFPPQLWITLRGSEGCG